MSNIIQSIIVLLNSCPRLTHLSLTGVHAFLRDDLSRFCREAPAEFTAHQRDVFCVFSGAGVLALRRYLNEEQRNVRRAARSAETDDDGTITGEDDDQTMTGLSNQVAGTEIGHHSHHANQTGEAIPEDDDDQDEELDGAEEDEANGGAALQP